MGRTFYLMTRIFVFIPLLLFPSHLIASQGIDLSSVAIPDEITIDLPQESPPPVAPTPLEEIEEEENTPEDFFDFQTLDLAPTLPPLSWEVEGGDLLSPQVTYDMPIVLNKLVENYIVLFQTRLRDHFQEWLARSGRYIPLMHEILREYDLPDDLVFLALIESGFNPKAFSKARAAGPWQFIKGTGKKYGLRIDQWIDERRDPLKSTAAAAKYLRDLYKLFGSWPLSLASYNAGEGRIMRAMARTKADDFWDLRGSRHIRPETKHYVPKYMAATIIAKNPEKYGFFIDYHDLWTFDEVEISRPTSLKSIAKAAGVSLQEIKAMNPELKKDVTPPRYPNYRLKLPVGTKETFLQSFAANVEKELKLSDLQKHQIAKGETLSSIARKYGLSVQKLQEANELGRSSMIRAGRSLIIPLEN